MTAHLPPGTGSLFGRLVGLILDRRQVRFTAHPGVLLSSNSQCLFLSLTNTSRTREVVVTHVYLDTRPQIPVDNPERSLPVRLAPDEPWETWIELNRIPAHLHARLIELGRARLSTGRVVKARPNPEVPESGVVAGSPRRES